MKKTIERYLNVYKILLILNWKKLFTYRASLISGSIAHTVWASFVIIQIVLLTSKISSIFGWTRNELLLLAATYNICNSIIYFLFSRNFSELATTIHFGRLDAILTKPIDSQFLITCTTVSYTQIIRFIIGILCLIFIIGQMQVKIHFINIVGFCLLLIFSIIIIYSLWLLVMTLTVWYSKLSNLNDLLYEMNQVTKFPQEIYRGASKILFFALFPLTLVIAFPVKTLLNKILLGDVFLPLISAVVLFVLARKFWQYALRSYASASG